MQKKIYAFKLLLMLPYMIALLSSCSSSSNNNDEDGGKEDKINVVGVWSDGKHFLSVNSDKFLTSYVASNFIDCGNIIEDGKEIICHNVYFNKNTTYKILSIDRSKLNISVSYKDIAGESKSANLIKIIGGRKFQELDRKLRQELIAIDGATIIDYDGNILAVGAIIKIEAGSTGGGRLAAAKTLSNYGVSMKISNDGRIEGFRMDRSKLRVKPLFVIG